MAICNGVATVLRYSTTVVKRMASVDRMTENGEWERMRKETFMIYFKVLSQNSPWIIHKTPQAKLTSTGKNYQCTISRRSVRWKSGSMRIYSGTDRRIGWTKLTVAIRNCLANRFKQAWSSSLAVGCTAVDCSQ